MPSAAARAHTLQSAERALAILRTVCLPGRRMRLADVSALTGLDKSTTHRILSTLMAEGIIRRDAETGGYAPDLRAWLHLMPSAAPGVALVAGIQKALDLLAEATGMTAWVVLPVPGGRETQAALWSVPTTAFHYDPVNAPESVPYHASSSGKCLLADMPPEELRRYLEQPLERLTKRTITSRAKLRKELARIREQGYALHAGEITPLVGSVGVLLRAPAGPVLGGLALGISGLEVAEKVSVVLPHLREAQQSICHLLSYDAWMELVLANRSPAPLLPSLWDIPAPGFGDGPVLMVRTVSRMVRLIATLLRRPEGVSVRSLARERELDKTTTWRLLHTLVAGGVVWQDAPEERFRISPAYWLRHRGIMRAAISLTHVVARVLRDLASNTGATALLVVPDRDMRHAVICHFALPQTPMCFHPEHAPFPPLHTTSAGKVYLAAQSKLAIGNYMRGGLPALTGRSITTREGLLRELDEIRKAGYALDREEWASGVGGCAALVTDVAGNAVASLSVSPAISALNPENVKRWVPLIREAAQALSPLLVGNWRARLGAEQ